MIETVENKRELEILAKLRGEIPTWTNVVAAFGEAVSPIPITKTELQPGIPLTLGQKAAETVPVQTAPKPEGSA